MQYEVLVNKTDVQRKLTKLQGTLLDWRDAMFTIGQAFKQYYATKPFASRGSIYGQPWPSLISKRYEAWKSQHYRGYPILVRSGDLSRGFNFASDRAQVRLFNAMSYFKKHQLGSTQKSTDPESGITFKGTPQRTIMALNQELVGLAGEIMGKQLQIKMRGL